MASERPETNQPVRNEASAVCQALQLSDASRCNKEATNTNNLFCWFHAKQVYGLYKGYKRRNALLDRHDETAPNYLKDPRRPLANEAFNGIKDEKVLADVHAHLFDKYVLLGKVIDARKLHHKYFYSSSFDYGHQAYIDGLSSQRHTVLRSLERLGKRTADVLYHQEQWYDWVRKVQEEDEAARDKEQKRVKAEAALFKRHKRTLQAKLEQTRRAEETKMQDAYLEAAYQERLDSRSEETDDDDAWDPIEDVEYDQRALYIDLIRHFLWMDQPTTGDEAASSDSFGTSKRKEPGAVDDGEAPKAAEAAPSGNKPKKKSKAKGRAVVSNKRGPDPGMADQGQDKLIAMQENGDLGMINTSREPDKSMIETEAQMRKRLSQGVEKNLDHLWGFQLVGTIENPHETFEKTAPMTEAEIVSAVADVREIRLLLFSRLLLAQASLLPAALKATTVDQFLGDKDIAVSELRDLCLKLEDPSLQTIRDACADFARQDKSDEEVDRMPLEEEVTVVEEESENEQDEDEVDEEEELAEMIQDYMSFRKLKTGKWLTDRLTKDRAKAKAIQDEARARGMSEPKSTSGPSHRVRVTICGKRIWNHASEKAMRDGWLHFSIMAKGCDLKDAIQLCRNWKEFSDLNLLTHWQYFPASNWTSWGQNKMVQQLHELEFFPYFMDISAAENSYHDQSGARGRLRRRHDFAEKRNVIVGHMKRIDPVTRRFLHYLLMRAGQLLVMVRDGKTGRIITAPDEEHLWTYRKKQGLGRASKNEWREMLEVGPVFAGMIDILRDWHFGFDDHYSVFIWDFVPGQSALDLYMVVISELRNAWRITRPRDLYLHMRPVLETLTREADTMRTRKIKEGEQVQSLWETVAGDQVYLRAFEFKKGTVKSYSEEEAITSPYMFYSDANAAEDSILFPEDIPAADGSIKRTFAPFRHFRNGATDTENGITHSIMGYMMGRFQNMGLLNSPRLQIGSMAGHNDQADLWHVPTILETALLQVTRGEFSIAQHDLLKRTGLDKPIKAPMDHDNYEAMDKPEVMERDRSLGFKQSFHAADLEPGAIEKYQQTQRVIDSVLRTFHVGSTDWILFVADILDWLELRVDYDNYDFVLNNPWPHSFIAQDIVRAFVAMAMFFPDEGTATIVTKFLQSPMGEAYRSSGLFDPQERGKSAPDRRGKTSYLYRESGFWDEWKEFMKGPRYFADAYPMEWSLAIRPIIAKLYKEGIISPAHFQNDREIVPGMATASIEPGRAGKRDLFISYDDPYKKHQANLPANFISPDRWPKLLPLAQKFAGSHPQARFALLRLWSAPHFYPLMVGPNNRQGLSFMDSAGRVWQWKFVPKDMPASEYSQHRTTGDRLDLLRHKFGDRVVHRGELMFVMGEDGADLLKYCTAVTFAIQTKPWLREVDLWKSFVNVDIDVLQGLDPFWLD